jgi:hypothetical protein
MTDADTLRRLAAVGGFAIMIAMMHRPCGPAGHIIFFAAALAATNALWW